MKEILPIFKSLDVPETKMVSINKDNEEIVIAKSEEGPMSNSFVLDDNVVSNSTHWNDDPNDDDDDADGNDKISNVSINSFVYN